jgi:galactose mutarotase-like enzyme
MHQIENGFLKIRAREYGAELTSLFDKKNNVEHLWQADPDVWPWHAPVLFPVIGRCLNDEISIDGKKYPMQKHGFGRKSDFKLLDLTQSRMIFSLKASKASREIYPFDFELLIGYNLKKNALHVSYEIINRDKQSIYFSIGGHPGFAIPFKQDEGLHDYYIEFEKRENSSRHYVDESGFFNGREDVSLADSNIIELKNGLFRDDALVFKDLKSHTATIRSKRNPHYVTLDFSAFKYLGLWAKVGAQYVCIEPWLGCADTAGKPVELKDKEGVISLQPGQTFTVSFTVEIG